MPRITRAVMLAAVVVLVTAGTALAATKGKATKPSPAQVIEWLKKGNARFAAGRSIHPHANRARLALAAKESQARHALATVLTCSDSRVPVELIFDAGVMDLFVVRVAGNICNTDEVGSIEYGLAHARTPVLVVLGHTDCGAVTTVVQALTGHAHPLERNIPPLISAIIPAVKAAQKAHPRLHGRAIIPKAIKANVWLAIYNLFLKSPSTRRLVASGAVKVVGAIYDVGTGKVKWLSQAKVKALLARAGKAPNRAVKEMAPLGSGR